MILNTTPNRSTEITCLYLATINQVIYNMLIAFKNNLDNSKAKNS